MARWILAHGNGLDELVVLGFGMALAVAVRLLVAHRPIPEDPEEPTVREQQPDPPAPHDQFDPAAAHGRDLDPRTDRDEDPTDQTLDPDQTSP